MLRIPPTGAAPSVNAHNGRLDVQADWVEASALFSSERILRIDIVDSLIDNNSYRDRDFANAWVVDIFRELSRRFKLLGDNGLLICDGDSVRRKGEWPDRPAYAFCLTLAMLPHYREEVEGACGKSYVDQGLLFEQLSEWSLRSLQWDVSAVGWSHKASSSVENKVSDLAGAIGEPSLAGGVARWTEPNAKDAGVDLVAWRSFPDGWGGRPICLVQCASGADWVDKLHSPYLGTWEKLIDFSTKPRRGLTMPFAVDSEVFRRRANADNVMLLMDRHRLLSPSQKSPSLPLSPGLGKKLIAWTKKRVAAFPSDDK
jgi:DNA (cytosine-5)-methyltransferase 1